MTRPNPLPNGLREYINNVADRLQRGDLTRESDEMATIKEKLQKEESICGAIMKGGKVCTKKPTNEKNLRCNWHGGKSTGATTEEGRKVMMENLKKGHELKIHGLYSKKFLDEWTQEEKDFYHNTLEWYKEKYDLEPLDEVALDRFLVNSIKAMRVDSVGMDYAINLRVSLADFEGKAIRQAETLGLNRKYRKSRDNSDNPSGVNYNVLFDGMDGK
ncbi:HGGxSTG domain-containing protein [Bacillus nitratireducens]|uniref:HGGxSTG domain-containing protein n=1 Tax=Bacillus nitratireducens TaxID=2026193 RepID=UPI002E20C490|nr:HGGxSTG domain-containing protein [Bacillus nitratireducens]